MIERRQVVILFLLLFAAVSLRAEHTDTLPLGPGAQRLTLQTVEAGKIVDTRSGREVAIADIVSRLAAADVVVVGEYHDSPACHRFQRDLVREISKNFPRAVVGFEFFLHRADDAALATWLAGKGNEADLLRAVGWYEKSSMHYGYTRMVMEAVKETGLAAIGLNAPRALVHRVAGGGLAVLSAEERRPFAHVERKNPEHRYYIQQVFGAAALRLPPWFERIYAAQTCWDSVMAASMHDFLASRPGKGKKGVIIAGSAHVAYGLGVPFRYRLGKRRARLLTIVPVRVEKQDEDAASHPMLKMMAKNMPPVGVFSAGIADYVLGLPAEERGLPSLDVSGHEEDGVFVVDKVGEESLPHRLGLRPGDRILRVDDKPVSSQAELRLLLGMDRETPLRVRLERALKPAAFPGSS
ncbi:MAG: ChaN family lipoprotein [Acidobacteriota bacterium]|jgi:uncharacterized iron-regulated protein|nr:ChaN family lipoprotein [Acidobacteriota bacterium]